MIVFRKSKLFSDDEDYSKQGALIGAGIGAAALGISGLDNFLANKSNKETYKLWQEKGLGKIANYKDSRLILDLYKNGGDKFKENLIKKIDDKLFETTNNKELLEAVKEGGEELIKSINKKRTLRNLGITGLIGGGLAGAGYGIGKSKKKKNKKNKQSLYFYYL